ncbi:hypothetical protein SAY86_003826 [Trapa natans]|uniref:Uncharacterized protein n=1 Tax=Trapa natans TaxID=22666 RepID=A0AAN7MEM5_TRANT|nr:hypothetical protein SAY86_003826 [Trapa natans]
MAVFMGVTFSQSESPETRSHCKVDIEDDTDRSLLVYEVISLACYLLSSLVAKALSIELSTYLFRDVGKFIRFGSMFTRDSMLMPPWVPSSAASSSRRPWSTWLRFASGG